MGITMEKDCPRNMNVWCRPFHKSNMVTMIQTFINMFTSFVNTFKHLICEFSSLKVEINFENENKIKHFPIEKLIEFTNDYIGC